MLGLSQGEEFFYGLAVHVEAFAVALLAHERSRATATASPLNPAPLT